MTELEANRAGQLVALVLRLWRGERIQLRCHCYPKRCHGDDVAAAVHRLYRGSDGVGGSSGGTVSDNAIAAGQRQRPRLQSARQRREWP